uniref:phosphopyruvate hydratase n=1 Tax=Cyanistes caeruleus TaxID=156563 RepID=A0A8C0U7E2_CYACU
MGAQRATSEHLDMGVSPTAAGGVCLWRPGSGWDPHDFGLDSWVPYPTAMSIHKIAALELLKAAIEKAGYLDKVVIGMDIAAADTLITQGQLYESFIKDYAMVSTENPSDQNNVGGWKWFLTQADIQVVGSLFTKGANAPHHCGHEVQSPCVKTSCTTLVQAHVPMSPPMTPPVYPHRCKLAQSHGWGVMPSLSPIPQIKTGAPCCCSKHFAKYNQLMR